MSDTAQRPSIEDLEVRQDRVLEELDRLNEQIEQVIAQYLPPRRELSATTDADPGVPTC